MRVNKITTNYSNYNNTFKSLRLSNGENDYSDTSFFRDSKTLEKSANLLKSTFPQGCDILDFAASNGEESISLYSYIGDDKFKIHAYDRSEKAIDLGKKGVYSIFNIWAKDRFLINDSELEEKSEHKKERQLRIRELFNKIMERVSKPEYEINDSDFLEMLEQIEGSEVQYFKLKDKFRDKFEFDIADINQIEDLAQDKEVGAVLFRNAMYIPTGNLAVNEFSFDTSEPIDKEKVIEDIVKKVYNALKPEGLFILGNIEKEHIYLADEKIPQEEKYFIREYCVDIFKESPLRRALEKNGRFKPVGYSKVSQPHLLFPDELLPTIWQKTKDSKVLQKVLM